MNPPSVASAASVTATPGASAVPPLRRLLEQMRERIRYLHYSIRTEEACVHWVRTFVRFHGLLHPRHLGAAEVQAMVYTNVLKVAGSALRSPLDALQAP